MTQTKWRPPAGFRSLLHCHPQNPQEPPLERHRKSFAVQNNLLPFKGFETVLYLASYSLSSLNFTNT